MLRFAIPSKGSLYDGSLAFLESCGLRVSRPNPRRYTASIRAMPDVEVLLHRPADIVEKIAEGEIHLGISGLDLVQELQGDDDDTLVIDDDLGFGGVELVVAVPESWIDVTTWNDLADLAVELQAQGRPLRIATKYMNLMRRFCYSQGINVFRLVESQGATEAAPGLGYADIIADVTETGTTLRDNQLKIVGGPILRSQACLVANRRALRADAGRLALVRDVLELVEARRRGRQFFSIVANVPGASVEEVGRLVTARPALAGLQGPTIAPVWDKLGAAGDGNGERRWFAVNMTVPQNELLPAVAHLRGIGASSLTVLPVQYVFHAASGAYEKLLERLG
jgi:ATP phosphoribosyltransferase